MKQLNQGGSGVGGGTELSLADVEKFKSLVEQSAKLSEIMNRNFTSISSLAEKINQIEGVSSQKITELNGLANALNQASQSIGDEKH